MEDNQDNSFSFILENCNESKMFRNTHLGQLTLRDTVDSVFLNMLTLYMLSKEFETAPFAKDYAQRTLAFGNFTAPRISGTDLYQGLHILFNPTGGTAQQLKAHDQNLVLAKQLRANTKLVKQFLTGIANGTLDRITAVRLMYRLEGQMGIDVSNYKSLRRLITDWENLTTHQRELCVTRLLQYYRVRGKRSELLPVLDVLSRNKGYEITDAGNAELAALGAGTIAGSRSGDGFLKSVAKVGAAGLTGYAIGRAIATIK
jgi:hypothetical protein